VVLQLTTQVTR